MVTNEKVLGKILKTRSSQNNIKNKEVNGHVLKYGGLLGLIIKGFVEGKHYRGRLRMQYMRQIMEGSWM